MNVVNFFCRSFFSFIGTFCSIFDFLNERRSIKSILSKYGFVHQHQHVVLNNFFFTVLILIFLEPFTFLTVNVSPFPSLGRLCLTKFYESDHPHRNIGNHETRKCHQSLRMLKHQYQQPISGFRRSVYNAI